MAASDAAGQGISSAAGAIQRDAKKEKSEIKQDGKTLKKEQRVEDKVMRTITKGTAKVGMKIKQGVLGVVDVSLEKMLLSNGMYDKCWNYVDLSIILRCFLPVAHS